MLALNSRSRVNHRKEVFKNKNPKGIESMKKAILVLIGLTMLVQCGSLWNDVPILGDVLGNQDELEKKDLQKRNLTLAALVASQRTSSPSSGTISVGSDGVSREFRSCPTTEPISPKSETTATNGSITIRGGSSQVTSNNQDAFLQKKEGNNVVWCYLYDSSIDDSGVSTIYFNEKNLIVAFTVTGGNTSLKASTDAFQKSYGSNGGPKITFLAILDSDTGAIQRGTFLGTRMDSNSQGRVSGLGISSISVSASGSIDLKGSACYDEGTATNSIATDKSCSVGCTGNPPWSGSLSATLSTLSSGKCL